MRMTKGSTLSEETDTHFDLVPICALFVVHGTCRTFVHNFLFSLYLTMYTASCLNFLLTSSHCLPQIGLKDVPQVYRCQCRDKAIPFVPFRGISLVLLGIFCNILLASGPIFCYLQTSSLLLGPA